MILFLLELNGRVDTQRHYTVLRLRTRKTESTLLKYPLLENIFKEALGPSVEVFSQANLVAASLSDYLLRHPEMVGEIKAKNVFITTGDPVIVSARATQFLKRSVKFKPA